MAVDESPGNRSWSKLVELLLKFAFFRTIAKRIGNGMHIHSGEGVREDCFEPLVIGANALPQALLRVVSRVDDIVWESPGMTFETAWRLVSYCGGNLQSPPCQNDLHHLPLTI